MDDLSAGTDQGRYVRSEDMDSAGPVSRRGWIWPWGIVGLIGFLALTGFFMALLRPRMHSVPINETTAMSPASTTPLGDSVPLGENGEPLPAGSGSVAPPLPTDSPLVTSHAVISADPNQPNPVDGVAAAEASQPFAMAEPEPRAAAAVAPPPGTAATPSPAAAPLTGSAPRIALMVMDLGGDARVTQAAIDQLPDAVDLGFTPLGAAAHMKLAMRGGHRVWLGLPMQPKRYPAIDPGPRPLLLKNSAAQNSENVRWALQQATPGIAGFYNIMGSAFTARREALEPVMTAASQGGLAIFDMRADKDTVAAQVAREQQIPAVLNEAYLDAEPGRLTARLDELVRRAKGRGIAVGVLSPRGDSIEALKAWLETPLAKSVTLVSPRAVADSPALQKLQP